MRTIFNFLASGILVMITSFALADEVANNDAQLTIQNQIQAFRAGDDAKAYSYAAPNILTFFPTVDSFMAMVKNGYSPVWQPQLR